MSEWKRFEDEVIDERIVTLKSCTDGWGDLTLSLTLVHSWNYKVSDFLKALDLDSPPVSTERTHFNRLLNWFNKSGADHLTIQPPNECQPIVIFDQTDLKAIHWTEANKMFVYCWHRH